MKNERMIVWVSVSLASALLFFIIESLFVLPIVTAQKKQDVLVLRAGSEHISGRLKSLDSTLVQFNKTPYDRSKVDIIRLSGATDTAPQANDQDQVLMRDGRLLLGYISKINNRIVVQKGNQLNRSQVALIKLAFENDSSGKDKDNKDRTTFGDTIKGTTKTPVAPGGDVPPWGDDDANCKIKGKIHMGPSGGSPYRYDEKGNVQGLFPSGGLRTCNMVYYICLDKFFKGKVINVNAGDKCPEWNVEYREICCDRWVEAKRKKSPCNPMLDSDCDGVSNDEDDYPTDSSKSKIRAPA